MLIGKYLEFRGIAKDKLPYVKRRLAHVGKSDLKCGEASELGLLKCYMC